MMPIRVTQKITLFAKVYPPEMLWRREPESQSDAEAISPIMSLELILLILKLLKPTLSMNAFNVDKCCSLLNLPTAEKFILLSRTDENLYPFHQLPIVVGHKNVEQIPMKKVGETTVPKTEFEFDVEDIKKVENYAKAINMLYCAVNPDDYRKISCCTTAKEMWDKLEVTYEDEKIDDMFDWFSKIIHDLHALKKIYANKDLVRKILRSLTPEWRSKANAIYESIGVSNVTIDGLRGNLKSYESTILTPSLDEQKKKGIALKATKEPVEEVSGDDDNEFGLVIKKFHKFMKKEFERKGRKHDGPPKCYGCGEIGHIKPRCPKAKHGKDKSGFKKQRAYISWGGDSGDESTDQEEDEAANLCLMAHEDQSDDVQEASSVLWYLDSGSSKHMTGDASKFLQIKLAKGGNVIFGDNSKGKIIGIGSVGKSNDSSIDNVLLVKGLKHNLLSISQLCDKGNRVTFDSKSCMVERLSDNKVILRGDRIDNIYMVNLDKSASGFAKCLMSKEEDTWLWHRRVAHMNMNLLNKLVSQNLVIGIPKLKFE
ncbi:unnamed protein product [Cuscuta campestris]|uniref:CCHC-type domain-containing protein n=1 Tax=Cuscuta campestris TaxID=132261 RepID=A0A484MG99_9ASTE|nr:unnamed protein product [Cuscuta campestris]